MFEIKPRVYDLQVTEEKMQRIKWGLFRDVIFQAKHFKKWKLETDTVEDFMEKTISIEMHEWITTVLNYGQMYDHLRLIKEVEDIINDERS